MPPGYMKQMLKPAQGGKFGIAASNMIDYNSARAIVDAAQELDAPTIVRLSVKTIRLWEYKPIAQWVHSLAADADVPVAPHLDHCTDLEVIGNCIDAGWTSVMFDGSALPFEENTATSKKAHELASTAGRSPEVAGEIVERGHEAVAHGRDWVMQVDLREADERRFVADNVASIERATGMAPHIDTGLAERTLA